jgi:hypothetical protein
MSRKTLDERLAELTRKRDQLEAQRTSLLAAKRNDDRKRDTRRKIIVGAAVLAHAELHPGVAHQLRAILDKAVTRDLDRQAIADLLPASSANALAAAGAAAKAEKAA